ncbi:hypothetical protein CC1G_09763 [Coprinopsis cinerea okayama7|uniref:Nucleoplasmin-like domain-containing protein n=1 Tax=Coprinopsis cinerea (strain Okayama-7 / 130 / ATCC MYA-4618 / FGSC 9003) TaxID=240176 RepID=A8PE27_COPC7|nr:hypothetical protein CC1G_09763 [Coprinopsis cinerea okayama7\|eukprot:XP_001840712.1 hypothetical protein CC1G_09763 [Coprinopsis cinerea okayama7\
MANPRQLPPTLLDTEGYWSTVLQYAYKYMIRPAAPLILTSASLPRIVPEYPGDEMGKNLDVDKTFRTLIRVSFGDYELNEGIGEAYIGALTPGLRDSIALNHILYPGKDYILEAFGKAHIHVFGKFIVPKEVNVAKTIVRVFRRLPTRHLKPQHGPGLPTPEAACQVKAAATCPPRPSQGKHMGASQANGQVPIEVKEEPLDSILLSSQFLREGGRHEGDNLFERGDGSADGSRDDRESVRGRNERGYNEHDYFGRGRDDRRLRDEGSWLYYDGRDHKEQANSERGFRRYEDRIPRDRRYDDRYDDRRDEERRFELRERHKRYEEGDRWADEREYVEREAAESSMKRFRREH